MPYPFLKLFFNQPTPVITGVDKYGNEGVIYNYKVIVCEKSKQKENLIHVFFSNINNINHSLIEFTVIVNCIVCNCLPTYIYYKC